MRKFIVAILAVALSPAVSARQKRPALRRLTRPRVRPPLVHCLLSAGLPACRAAAWVPCPSRRAAGHDRGIGVSGLCRLEPAESRHPLRRAPLQARRTGSPGAVPAAAAP